MRPLLVSDTRKLPPFIYEHSPGKFRAQIRRKGKRLRSNLFNTVEEAKKWLETNYLSDNWKSITRPPSQASWLLIAKEMLTAWEKGELIANTPEATNALDKLEERYRRIKYL